jgi:hypothetical protein
MLRFLTFSLVIAINQNLYGFDDSSCMKGEFSTMVEKSIDPFGYLSEVLTITKKKCDITIELNKAKYLSSKWHIDICREPIHIKHGKNLQNVVKKNESRCEKSDAEYCLKYDEIKTVLEDNGLIYGEGIREDLSTQHGRVYCSYLLVKQYLENSVVFSYEKPVEVALNGPTFMQGLAEKSSVVPKSTSDNEKTIFKDSNVLFDF